jgi:hypothetical protein
MPEHTDGPFHQAHEPNPAPTAEEVEPVALDDVYDLLRNRRSRYVLEYLEETSGSASLEELARQIAAREAGTEPHAVDPSEYERVLYHLYQCVLPKMDDFDAVTYDDTRHTVDRGEHADCFRPFLPRAVVERQPIR